jgi:hypothetical protein
MITLNEFHQDFLQSILTDAESRGLRTPQAFFENVCEELISSGDLTTNYTFAEYIKTGMEVYGYDYDEERQILSLLVYNFFQEEEMQTLTKTSITTKFNRLKTFLKKSVAGMYQSMEETSEAYSMAYNIATYYNNKTVSKVRLIILTDGKITRTLADIPSETIEGVKTEFRIIDIEYIYKIYLSQYNDGDFSIEVKLPCLEIPGESEQYQAYLTVVRGQDLVDIYDKFGQKLFEQNVRTFLQFKGAVNKGIRNTIEYNPDMFFAYNNGITATASEVELDAEGNIVAISNFQIVNGAQTTSAIYAANKSSNLDVSNVSVQMKLSVVKDKEKHNDFVSKVSEYANTQNKVNKSDFFSNSQFHKEMKNYSKKVWAPVTDGSQRRTHWFYERVRGEYLNEQAYLTKAGKTQFQLENPKKQLLDKTFLSKCENAWLQKPEIVAKGAEYSFSTFANEITDRLEKDNLAITESYFKDAVSRVILYRGLEKIVTKSEWYDGGFRAQTIAYTMAYLSYLVEKRGKYFNFNIIWDSQAIPSKLEKVLKAISKEVYKGISNPPKGYANIAQWAKQKACWDKLKELKIDITIDPKLLIDKEEEKYNKIVQHKEKKMESGIQVQMFVVNTPNDIWRKLYDYYRKNYKTSGLSSTQLDILRRMCEGQLMPPSERQSKILYDLYEKASSEGAVVSAV